MERHKSSCPYLIENRLGGFIFSTGVVKYCSATLLEKFWQISLLQSSMFSQIEGNYRKFRHIELSISVIRLIF